MHVVLYMHRLFQYLAYKIFAGYLILESDIFYFMYKSVQKFTHLSHFRILAPYLCIRNGDTQTNVKKIRSKHPV